jgi:hypothetical protein
MSAVTKVFIDAMSKVEKTEEFQVGPAFQGSSRAMFTFAGSICFLESRGYSRIPSNLSPSSQKVAGMALAVRAVFNPPSDAWWTDYMVYGKCKAQKVAKHYGATLWEAMYAQEERKWFHLWFEDGEAGEGFGKLMQFVWDRKHKVFEAEFGLNTKPYIDCISGKPEEIL